MDLPLHICFNCGSDLVYPLDWDESGPRHWRIILRCPSCEAKREGVFGQADVERLDDELDRGTTKLTSDLVRVTRSNMQEEGKRFIRALHNDWILPCDFGIPA